MIRRFFWFFVGVLISALPMLAFGQADSQGYYWKGVGATLYSSPSAACQATSPGRPIQLCHVNSSVSPSSQRYSTCVVDPPAGATSYSCWHWFNNSYWSSNGSITRQSEVTCSSGQQVDLITGNCIDQTPQQQCENAGGYWGVVGNGVHHQQQYQCLALNPMCVGDGLPVVTGYELDSRCSYYEADCQPNHLNMPYAGNLGNGRCLYGGTEPAEEPGDECPPGFTWTGYTCASDDDTDPDDPPDKQPEPEPEQCPDGYVWLGYTCAPADGGGDDGNGDGNGDSGGGIGGGGDTGGGDSGGGSGGGDDSGGNPGEGDTGGGGGGSGGNNDSEGEPCEEGEECAPQKGSFDLESAMVERDEAAQKLKDRFKEIREQFALSFGQVGTGAGSLPCFADFVVLGSRVTMCIEDGWLSWLPALVLLMAVIISAFFIFRS